MKAILHERITSESAHIHKPDGKLLMEGAMGILLSGSTHLTRMAISLKESIAVKHTHKRLQRMIRKPEHLDTVNRITRRAAAGRVPGMYPDRIPGTRWKRADVVSDQWRSPFFQGDSKAVAGLLPAMAHGRRLPV